MSDNVNLSRLREMATRGKNYRETIEVPYFGETEEFEVRPLVDVEFLPLSAVLEERMDIDPEEAVEQIEEEKETGDTDEIDMSQFDEEFVVTLQEAAALGLMDSPRPDEDEEPDEAAEWDERKDEVDGLIESLTGGKSMEIGMDVLNISSDAESAESFRRDGGGE